MWREKLLTLDIANTTPTEASEILCNFYSWVVHNPAEAHRTEPDKEMDHVLHQLQTKADALVPEDD